MAKGTKGEVVQVIGTVVDVEFPVDQLPDIYNAVEIDITAGAPKLIAEVQQHLRNHWVRCLTMDTTDGLRRGSAAIDTGAPISVPVGEPCLGRLFNVLGVPIDELGDVKSDDYCPIHPPPPALPQH